MIKAVCTSSRIYIFNDRLSFFTALIGAILFIGLAVLCFAPLAFAASAKPSVDLKEFLAIEGHLTNDSELDKVSLSSPCGKCQDWKGTEKPTLGFTVTIRRPGKRPLILDAPDALCFNCGGVKGAPITGLPEITAGKILEVSYSGGSREYWSHNVKWRFNEAKDAFELIGYTASVVDTLQKNPKVFSEDQVGNLVSLEINYRTRIIEKKVVGKNRKPKLLKCALPTLFKTPFFYDFNYEEFNSGGDDCR